jgi:hypothetical protein
MNIEIEGRTCIHSTNRMRTVTQKTATNIPVGGIEHNLLSCVRFDLFDPPIILTLNMCVPIDR